MSPKTASQKKWIRLLLDSTYVRRSDGTYGVRHDGSPDTSTGNYVWNDVSYELSKVLSAQKIAELRKATGYRFKLDSISWRNKTQNDNVAFKVNLPGVHSESQWSNRALNYDSTLEVIYEGADSVGANPRIAYQTKEDYGLVSESKAWLAADSLRIQFTKADDAPFNNWEFGSATAATNTTTSYLAVITIEYEMPE